MEYISTSMASPSPAACEVRDSCSVLAIAVAIWKCGIDSLRIACKHRSEGLLESIMLGPHMLIIFMFKPHAILTQQMELRRSVAAR